jgi:hypothetical protein
VRSLRRRMRSGGAVQRRARGTRERDHDVLDALARPLRSTEAGYFTEAEVQREPGLGGIRETATARHGSVELVEAESRSIVD